MIKYKKELKILLKFNYKKMAEQKNTLEIHLNTINIRNN